MKKISIYTSIAVLFTVLFSSCKKNNEYNYDANGGQKIVHFVAMGGYDTYFGNSNIAADPADSAQIVEMQIEYVAPVAGFQDIIATIAVDTPSIAMYNATVQDPAGKYELLPMDAYSIPLKTIKIKAGESLSDVFDVIIDGTKVDGSKNLMLPIKIVSISGAPSGAKVASATGIAYLHFIGNPLAGSYSVVGTRTNYTGPISGGVIAGVTNLSGPKAAVAIDPQNMSIDYANLGGSGWQYVITYDGTTISAAPNETMAKGITTGSYSTHSITYDAATKVIHVVSEYTNTAGNTRLVDETWTHQ